MLSFDQTPKRFRLLDVLALAFAVLVLIWAFRERSWIGALVVAAVTALAAIRNAKGGFRAPISSSPLVTLLVAVLFAGPFAIVLVAILRADLFLPTTLTVALIYAILVVLGARIRRRGTQ
jgi:small basic protein